MCTHHGNPCVPGTGSSQQNGSMFLCPVSEGGFPGFCCLFPNGNPLFIINRGRESAEVIYESLFLLFAIQQEKPYKTPFVDGCRLLLEMIWEENETCFSALKLSVSQRRAPWALGWQGEPLGPGLLCRGRPLPACSLTDGERLWGGCTYFCCFCEGGRRCYPSGFLKEALTALWTAVSIVALASLAKNIFFFFDPTIWFSKLWYLNTTKHYSASKNDN